MAVRLVFLGRLEQAAGTAIREIEVTGALGAILAALDPDLAATLSGERIKLAVNPQGSGDMEIVNSASTQKGFSLPQVAELSKKVGLNYQMAFREKSGAFVVPSVVHWKVGHYAALVRQEGDRFLLEDPTFGNTVWASQEALEAETSGYFLLPPGPLPKGWRFVEAKEGAAVWGKGLCGL